MAKSAKRKEVIPDWLDAELKALPDLDEGLDLDLPGLDDSLDIPGLDDSLDIPGLDEGLDFPGLDAALADLPELPGFEVDLEALGLEPAILRSPKNVRARVVGNENDGATKSKPLCGAKTRTGKPCKAPGNGKGGRCKLHGGKSTGPKTFEGKARSLAALQGNRPNRKTLASP